MTVNYRDVQDRFTHIDATFVRAETNFSPDGGHVAVTVRFYPWWEHPSYIEARDTGASWGFSDASREGARNVVVRAVMPLVARIGQREEVTDWAFSETHPLLWEFSDDFVLYVNGTFDVPELIDRLLALGMPSVTSRDLHRYFDPAWVPLRSSGIRIPAQLYDPTVSCLTQMNVVVLPDERPTVPKLTAFVLDEEDYIVAEDFVLDMPEFEHRPEWFVPA